MSSYFLFRLISLTDKLDKEKSYKEYEERAYDYTQVYMYKRRYAPPVSEFGLECDKDQCGYTDDHTGHHMMLLRIRTEIGKKEHAEHTA